MVKHSTPFSGMSQKQKFFRTSLFPPTRTWRQFLMPFLPPSLLPSKGSLDGFPGRVPDIHPLGLGCVVCFFVLLHFPETILHIPSVHTKSIKCVPPI